MLDGKLNSLTIHYAKNCTPEYNPRSLTLSNPGFACLSLTLSKTHQAGRQAGRILGDGRTHHPGLSLRQISIVVRLMRLCVYALGVIGKTLSLEVIRETLSYCPYDYNKCSIVSCGPKHFETR